MSTGNRRASGESHGRSKLTEDVVIECRTLVRGGVPVADLAATCGVSVPTMWRAVVGITWASLPGALGDWKERARKDDKNR